ncbi:putative adhesin [Endozoicomonas euniceicola]
MYSTEIPYSTTFCVPGELRLLFYCLHGTIMTPYLASPIPLMQGSFEACEVVSGKQPCFNYTLCPKEGVCLGSVAHISEQSYKIYKAIIKADRLERSKTGETRAANVYDILLPAGFVQLRDVLTEIIFRFPHYRNIHCLFSRKVSGENLTDWNPYKLPSRFIQGQTGRWEFLEIDDLDFSLTDS